MLRPKTYDMFTFKSIEHLSHRLTPEKVDADRFLQNGPVKFSVHSMLTVVFLSNLQMAT